MYMSPSLTIVLQIAVASLEATSGFWFSHRKRGTDFSREKRFEPLALLFRGAKSLQDFHVAGVRRRTVEHFWSQMRSAHHLAERRVLIIRQSCTPIASRQEEIPQTFALSLCLKLLHQGDGFPGPEPVGLLVKEPLTGVNVRRHEIHQPLAQIDHGGREFKVHRDLLADHISLNPVGIHGSTIPPKP
jgi:hypothetical protein